MPEISGKFCFVKYSIQLRHGCVPAAAMRRHITGALWKSAQRSLRDIRARTSDARESALGKHQRIEWCDPSERALRGSGLTGE